jgi:TP901 family phage tail tape measure protein
MSINIDVHGNTTPLERDVQAAVKRINRTGGIKIRLDEKGVTQPLGNMKRSADEFTKSLEASNARVLAFGASVGIINAVADAFKGLVTSTMKVEKNLTDINVVMGLTNKQLDKFGGGLFKVAKETGAGFDAASEAATEFARQGLSVNETLKRTKDALVLTRLTGMKAAESVKSLTAAMNTFKGEISDSTALVSKFAAVDVKFAVSAEDFAQAIARSGQAARDAGVDINQLIGLVTAAQERTARGGAVIGNSFKTIFTRVQRSSTLNELENIGIAVRDLSGNTLPAIKILESLAKKYDHLNDAQRAYISQNVAGVFQVNILKAALADLGKANSVTAQATQIAASATDESNKKNEQLRQTMSALAGETGVAVQQLAKTIGDIALAPGINKVLDGIKGMAEWATGILGNGENEGNKFAQGLLKGIGNVITGPGLVVFGALFTKLFVNAAKYAASSLSSLLNINKSASARKNIEQSLMMVLTQNAALQQEMLRTDISRAQKEQMILNIIKQQTVEAQKLSQISRSMSPGLIKSGVGPNLAYKPRRAFGFVPNFADGGDEKQMARAGGYTPGHLRSMNIPGAGGVIYNSSETVKRFPGLSQPAIMPPQSSKAGENYKKMFGAAHGFDPYAANGFVPNFAVPFDQAYRISGDTLKTYKGLSSRQQKDLLRFERTEASKIMQGNELNKVGGSNILKSYLAKQQMNRKYAMFVPPEGFKSPVSFYKDGKKPQVSWPVYGLKPKLGMKDPNLSKMMEKSFKEAGSQYASKIYSIIENPDGKVSGEQFWSKYKSDKAGGAMGAYNSAVGAVFETAVNAAMNYAAKVPDGQADFDVRGADKNKLSRIFNISGVGLGAFKLGDYKNNSSSVGNRRSFYQKIAKQEKFKPNKAFGYIPNFAANALTDAIEREKGAGIPVSQIRVGTHSRLKNQSNPLGIGVTNTKDEPNGLADVFKASGFVPNFAIKDFFTQMQRDPEETKKIQAINDKLVKKKEKQLKALDGHTRTIKKLENKNNLTDKETSKLANARKLAANTEAKLKQTTDKLIASNQAAASTRSRSGRAGAAIARNGAMAGFGGMFAADMIAGQITSHADPTNRAAHGSAGMLSGAATGAMMGSFLGPLGAVAGGFIGAATGMISGINSANEARAEEKRALEEAAEAARKNAEAFNKNSFAQTLGKAAATNTVLQSIGASASGSVSLVGRNNKSSVSRNAALGQTFMDGQAFEGSVAQANAELAKRESDIFKGMTISDAMDNLEKTIAGNGDSGFNARMYNAHNLNNRDGEFFEAVTKYAENPTAGGFADLKTNFNEDYSSQLNKLKDASTYLAEGLSGRFSSARRFIAHDPTEGLAESGKAQQNKDRQGYAVKNLAKFLGSMDSGAKADLRGYAQAYQNEFISNIYTGGVEGTRIHDMKIQRGKETIDAKLTGREIADIHSKGTESETAKRLNLSDEDIKSFREENIKAIKQQGQILKQQTENYIKTLNFQKVELSIRHQLNQTLQEQSQSSRELANKNKALSAIMGNTLSQAGRQKMQSAEQRLDINNARASSVAKAQADYKSSLFKSISGNTVASQSFRTLFGANRNAETGEVTIDPQALKESGLKTVFQKAYGNDTDGDKAFTKFVNNAKNTSVEDALSGIDGRVIERLISGDDGLAANNDALRVTLEGILEKRKNSLELSEDEYNSAIAQLGIMDQINDTIAEQADTRKKASDVLAFDIKQQERGNQLAQKRMELSKMSRQVRQGPGYINFATGINNQISNINKSTFLQAEDLRDQDGFAARQFNIDQQGRYNQRDLLDQQIASSSDEENRATLQKELEILNEKIQLAQDERDAESKHNKDTIVLLERMAEKRKEMLESQLALRRGPDAFQNGINESMKKMSDESKDFEYKFGEAIPNAFANSLSSAMTNAIRQGGTLKETLTDAAISFLNTMNQMYAQQFARNASLALFGDGQAKYSGGLVRRNKGGLVPGRVTNGEYRMNPGAVSRYGVGMMDSLNAGHVPKKNSGGEAKKEGSMLGALAGFGITAGLQGLLAPKEQKKHVARQKDQFETDGAWKRHNMSAHYMQNNSRVGEYVEGLREQKRAETAAWVKKMEKRAQLGRSITNFVGNMAMSKLGNHLENSGAFAKADIAMGLGKEVSSSDGLFKGIQAPDGGLRLTQDVDLGVGSSYKAGDLIPASVFNDASYNMDNFSVVQGGNHGGVYNLGSSMENWGDKIGKKYGKKKKNSGGPVNGASGIDRIPAMLSEGEYVIRADAARKIGRPTLEKINSGRFNTGGIVSSNSSGVPGQESTGAMNNNISITVNVSDSGGTSEEKDKEGGSNKDKMDKMSARIKDQVVTVIKEESRPGGLLDKGGN